MYFIGISMSYGILREHPSSEGGPVFEMYPEMVYHLRLQSVAINICDDIRPLHVAQFAA